MGARVNGAGGSIITVEGGAALHGCTHRVIGDRIVCATYLCAAAAAGGEVRLTGVDYRAVSTVALSLAESGCEVRSEADAVSLRSTGALRSVRPVRTAPYPGFPTDAQPVLMAALLRSEGCTVFVENIFENRYRDGAHAHRSRIRRYRARPSRARRTDPPGDYIETKRIQKLWHEIAARIADAGGEDFLS